VIIPVLARNNKLGKQEVDLESADNAKIFNKYISMESPSATRFYGGNELDFNFLSN
jgi:hypothetical protein